MILDGVTKPFVTGADFHVRNSGESALGALGITSDDRVHLLLHSVIFELFVESSAGEIEATAAVGGDFGIAPAVPCAVDGFAEEGAGGFWGEIRRNYENISEIPLFRNLAPSTRQTLEPGGHRVSFR